MPREGLRPLYLPERTSYQDSFGRVARSSVAGKTSGAYTIVEHRGDADLSLSELNEFAEAIRSRAGHGTEVFFAAPFSSRSSPISLTLVLFRSFPL